MGGSEGIKPVRASIYEHHLWWCSVLGDAFRTAAIASGFGLRGGWWSARTAAAPWNARTEEEEEKGEKESLLPPPDVCCAPESPEWRYPPSARRSPTLTCVSLTPNDRKQPGTARREKAPSLFVYGPFPVLLVVGFPPLTERPPLKRFGVLPRRRKTSNANRCLSRATRTASWIRHFITAALLNAPNEDVKR